MSDDNKLYVKFRLFVKDCNECFGKTYVNVAAYQELLRKTPANQPYAINKHSSIVKTYLLENKDQIMQSNPNIPHLKFSERVYLNLPDMLREADKPTRKAIWSHLQYLLSLCDEAKPMSLAASSSSSSSTQITHSSSSHPSSSIANSIFDEAGSNEGKFLRDAMAEMSNTLSKSNYRSQEDAMKGMLTGGMFPKLLKNMTKGVQSGEINVKKMFKDISGVVSQMAGGENDQISEMMTTFEKMIDKAEGEETEEKFLDIMSDPNAKIEDIEKKMSELNVDVDKIEQKDSDADLAKINQIFSNLMGGSGIDINSFMSSLQSNE